MEHDPTPAIIRLPESYPAWAKKALDLGPQGIMFPMIENQKMAKKSFAHMVVRASDYGIDNGYLSNYEDELLIMCGVELNRGLRRLRILQWWVGLIVCKWDRWI
ncbi:putative hpcH/HpaI aldolase/citrate lyase domain, pyruvate kinase-like domain superfamily [Helianthus anomalus]